MDGLEVALLLGIALFWAYLSWRWRRRHFEALAAAIPGPKGYPLVGNSLEFIGSTEVLLKRILELSEDYNDNIKVWLGPYMYVAIKLPEDLQIVLNSTKTLGKDSSYRFFSNTVGEGLFTAPVEKWKVHRRIILPAFSKGVLESFIPVFNKYNKVMVEHLKEKQNSGQFNIYEFIEEMNIGIICETALGVDFGIQTTKKSDFGKAIVRASELDFQRCYKFWLYSDLIYNFVVGAKERQVIYEQLHVLPNELIQKRKEQIKQKYANGTHSLDEGNKLTNFLDILLDLSFKGAKFSDDDVRDEVVTMMIGGTETSALTVSYCCLMLAMHPEIQEKAYQEVLQVFGDSNRDARVEDLSELYYLEKVIKETMRRYPVGAIILREVKEDLQLTHYTLPGGCSIAIPVIAVHMDKNIYSDPKKFDPERFNEEEVNKRHKYSFLPFSGGPRGCIGSKYAMMSMKMAISSILRNYTLHTDLEMENLRLKIDLLLRSIDGFPVSIKPRVIQI